MAEQGRTMAEQALMLAERNSRTADLERQVAERDGHLAERDRRLAEKDRAQNWLQDELAAKAETIREMSGSKFWKIRDGYHALRASLQALGSPLRRGARALAQSLKKMRSRPDSDTTDFYGGLTLLPKLPAERRQKFSISQHRPTPRRTDIICFAIIDWSFRYQRPQQLMTQFATQGHRCFMFLQLDSASEF